MTGPGLRASHGRVSMVSLVPSPAEVRRLRLRFWLTTRLPRLLLLEAFGSVFFSHWSIVDGVLDGDGVDRQDPPWLLWEVAYSAELDPYIESFVLGIATRVRHIWGSSDGFPRPLSTGALSAFIAERDWPAGYDHWAYPAASVRMVGAACAIADAHAALARLAVAGDAAGLAAAYDAFLREHGALL